MIKIIATIQLVIFLTYIIFIYKRYGVLYSISKSTYHLEGQERWYFLLFLWSIAILNLFQGMEIYGFFTTTGLVFGGITIDHESNPARPIHLIGVIGAIVICFIGLFILHNIYIPAIILLAIMLAVARNENRIWYIEIAAMILVVISYFMI